MHKAVSEHGLPFAVPQCLRFLCQRAFQIVARARALPFVPESERGVEQEQHEELRSPPRP